MNRHIDYIPKRERNLEQRMEGTGSAEDGVSFRVKAQQETYRFRKYEGKGQDHGDAERPFIMADIWS